MSEINYQVLREKAEKATKGSYIVGHTSVRRAGESAVWAADISD